MLSQIQTEIDLLIVAIEKEIEYISLIRTNEHNPNLFAEYGGRTIGLTYALTEIHKTQNKINEHISDILKNTTDGNYIAKLGVLEDENRVLRDKIYLLEQDLKKYIKMQKRNSDSEQHPECFKEYTEDEIDKIIEDAYNDDSEYIEYDDSEEE